MMFGVAEREGEETEAIVEDIFSSMGEKQHFIDCVQVGTKSLDDKSRPIKVRMRNVNSATQGINSGRKLRGTLGRRAFTWHRGSEQRAERRRLVGIMREKINSDPSHFIRRGTVVSKDRFFLAQEPDEPEDIQSVESTDDEARSMGFSNLNNKR